MANIKPDTRNSFTISAPGVTSNSPTIIRVNLGEFVMMVGKDTEIMLDASSTALIIDGEMVMLPDFFVQLQMRIQERGGDHD